VKEDGEMVSIATLVIERADAGFRPTVRELEGVPHFQWDIHWEDLAVLCPSQVPVVPRPQRNALRIEVLPSREPRCSQKSPDGRGLAWLMSGGDPLAYGMCCRAGCPYLDNERP
jgi:hypothetical protein